MRQMRFDPAHGFNKVDGVTIVLRNTCRDGEDIRVENDVFGREAIGDQQLVGAFADFRFAREGVRLAFFIKGHDDHGGAILTGQACLTQEFGFAFFHRDGVNDALALNALEARFNHRPLRGVDHDRYTRNVRL